MDRLRRHTYGLVILTLGIGTNLLVQLQSVVASEVSLVNPEESLQCCIGVDIPSLEIARKVRSIMQDIPEFGPLNVARVGVGPQVLPYTDGLFDDLLDLGLEPRRTCLRMSEKHTLGEDVWTVHLGLKSETKAARPAAVMHVSEGRSDPVWTGRLVLLDSDFNKLREVCCTRDPIVSSNCQYIGVFADEGRGRWQTYRCSGELMAQVEVEPFGDEDPDRLVLSDAGYFVLIPAIPPFDGPRFDLHDPIGKLVAQETGHDWSGGYAAGSFADDGMHLLLVAMYHIGEGPTKEVAAYNHRGERIWTFVPDDQFGSCSAASISRRGSHAIVSFSESPLDSSKSVTYLLDGRGFCRRKLSGFAPSHVEFSASEKHVLLHNRSRIMILETFTGKTAFDLSLATCRDADFAEYKRLVALIEENSVTLRDMEGNILWSTRLPDVPMPQWPKVSLTDDGNELALVTGSEYRVYRRWSIWEKADLETKRLPPDSFPGLPDLVREYLDRHGYTIPQSFADSLPHNAISGEFRNKGTIDFAVLASKNRSSCIMVFWGGSVENISRIEEREDIKYLQSLGGAAIGFSRSIRAAKGIRVPAACRIHGKKELQYADHDGIEDYFVGKASVIHYFADGEWIGVLGSD